MTIDIPLHFEYDEVFAHDTTDTRFLPVKIWLLHLGKNRHGTYFTRDAVERAIPSLADTPILAFLEENKDGELDFSNHRLETVLEDGKIKNKYLGQAIGTIPSNNDAKFEQKVDEDGIERTYLTVKGLIWTKWDDPVNIINKLNSVNQSMELAPNPRVVEREDGNYYYEEFKFFGACALGVDVRPAMSGANIETLFTDDIATVISQKMQEFHTYFEKEDDSVVKEKTKEEEVKVPAEETKEVEDTKEVEEVTETEEVEETTEVTETETKQEEEFVDTKETEETETKEEETEETTEVDETVEDTKEEVETEEAVVDEEKEQLFAENKSLKEEIQALREYKHNREVEDLKVKFTGKLADEQLEKVFTENKSLSLEDIEKEIFATIGRLNFEASNTAESAKLEFSAHSSKNTISEPYGSFFKK